MQTHSVFVAALSFLAVACGGPQQEGDGGADEAVTQQAALTGPLLGNWCQYGRQGPLCITIDSSGNGYVINNGDYWCWLQGDLVFSGISVGPGGTMGTRMMNGSGTCGIPAGPESVTFAMWENDSFVELTENGYVGEWYRSW